MKDIETTKLNDKSNLDERTKPACQVERFVIQKLTRNGFEDFKTIYCTEKQARECFEKFENERPRSINFVLDHYRLVRRIDLTV